MSIENDVIELRRRVVALEKAVASEARIPLSAAPTGASLLIADGTGTTIHVSGTQASPQEYLHLWAANVNGSARYFNLTLNGVMLASYSLAAYSGLVKIGDGIPLAGTGVVGMTVVGIASAVNSVLVTGYVVKET
jgi:hypothetical protein